MKEAVEEGAGGIVPPLRGGQFFFKKKYIQVLGKLK
jgi:hypothetical protein